MIKNIIITGIFMYTILVHLIVFYDISIAEKVLIKGNSEHLCMAVKEEEKLCIDCDGRK